MPRTYKLGLGMAKKHDTSPPGRWTTLEELLLVCAVSRYGPGRWDAIAPELQNRIVAQRNYVPSPLITPQNCRDVFDGLLRRYSAKVGGGLKEEASFLPMLDELRRIRIKELRREVERHDVSIESLESKIKRLEEEREQSLKDEPDPKARPSPAAIPGQAAAAAACDDSNHRSFNESNSTGQKPELATVSRDSSNDVVSNQRPSIKPEPDVPEDPNPVGNGWEPVRDHDSSSRDRDAINRAVKETQTAEKEAAEGTRAGRIVGSGELRDPDTEATAASKQNGGDVQSSPSLSRKKKRRRVSGGVNGETEILPAQKRLSVVKPPDTLVDLIRVVRAHRLSSAFERRLRSQESERYRTLIRQHMDLRIINSRLDKGVYSHYVPSFYRDLLLLFNNAIIFHKKNSSQHTAALELRTLVLQQMKVNLRNPPSQSKASNPNKPVPSLHKPIKPSSTKTKSQTETKVIKKIGADSSVGISKGKKEQSFDGNNKRSSNNRRQTGNGNGNNDLSSHDAPENIKKEEKRENNNTNLKKKKGAVRFLRRLRLNSETDSDDDEDKNNNNNLDSDDENQKCVMERTEKGREEGGGKKRERIVTRSSAIRANTTTRRISNKRSVEENVGTRRRESREKDGGIGARKRLRRREVG